MALKYLFSAKYKDGSIYEQNPEDISITDPLRSCYFDLKQEEIELFELTDKKNYYLVDLSDGHFEINNVPFYLHDKALPLINMRLIFFRQHTHTLSEGNKYQSHEIMYRYGWQANDEKGNNIQHIIEIE